MRKLIFLGTGSARNFERQLTSISFVTQETNFLIDCGDGMGTLRQLYRAGISLESINDIFITHRHADHVIGMPHLLFNKLISNPSARINVYGPRQALKVVESITYQTHADFFAKEENRQRVILHPLQANETIGLTDSIQITSANVTGKVKSLTYCYAYKVRISKAQVVFSADMSPNPGFDRLAHGAGIMIHECFSTGDKEKLTHSLDHSTAKDAGIAAAKAGAKYLILTHLGMKKDIDNGKNLIREAQQYFSGKITLAQDLMEIPL